MKGDPERLRWENTGPLTAQGGRIFTIIENFGQDRLAKDPIGPLPRLPVRSSPIVKGGQTSQFAIVARPASSAQPVISAQSVTLVVSRTCPEFSARPQRFERKPTRGACYSSHVITLSTSSKSAWHWAACERNQTFGCERLQHGGMVSRT